MFNMVELLLLISVFLFLTGSTFFYHKISLWLIIVFAASVCIKLSYALALPYIGSWDEQFHAVVAKNMLTEPFHPKLFITKSLQTDKDNWTYYTTWIHKQPFFLWCIALSYKLFGINIIALRLPSIILSSSLVYPVYKMGELFRDKMSGVIAVTLFVFNPYINSMHNGSMPTDHNDLFFMSLICWAFFTVYQFYLNNKIRYVIIAGVLCGLAVLTKWLVGLLPLGLLGVLLLLIDRKEMFKNLLPIGLSVLATVLVFLPWQIYCYINFTNVFLHEMNYNALHIGNVVEGHEGNGIMHHFLILKSFLGYNYVLSAALIITGLFLINDKKTSLSIFIVLLVVHVFFMVVKTKMDNFTLILMPLYVVLCALVFSVIIQKFKNNEVSKLQVSAITFVFILTALDLTRAHEILKAPFSNYNQQNEFNYNYLKDLALKLDSNKKNVVIGCTPVTHPIILLYSNAEAYSFVPDSIQIQEMQQQNFNIIKADSN